MIASFNEIDRKTDFSYIFILFFTFFLFVFTTYYKKLFYDLKTNLNQKPFMLEQKQLQFIKKLTEMKKDEKKKSGAHRKNSKSLHKK